MTKLSNWKTLLAFVLFVTCLELPASAQKSDMFFRPEASYENRLEGNNFFNLSNQHFGDDNYINYYLYNQQFGQTMPLGDGLLILLGAGACYAMRKRKRKQDSSLRSE